MTPSMPMNEEPEEPQKPKPVKSLISKSHAEVIAQVWESMGQENRLSIYNAVARGLQEALERGELDKDQVESGTLRFAQVVEAGWCLGFNHCMAMMEAGLLVQIGKVKGGQN